MIFKDISYFWLMVILPLIIAIIVVGIRRRRMFLENLGDIKVIKRISGLVSTTKRFWKNVLILLILSLLVTAIARPQIGVEKLKIKRKGVDVFILLDTSLSMAAQDLKPDRITRAKIWISSLIDNLENDRIGIIAFAGKPFLQCPLTADYSACRMLLEIVDVGTIPVQGTNIADAIHLAIESFPEKKGYFKVIILVTDGEDHEGKVKEVTESAANEGIKIIAVGIGGESGEPLPIKDDSGLISEYKKDKKGNIVMSKLNRELLESIAKKTKGAYFSASYGNFDMGKVIGILDRMEKEEFGEEWLERFEDRFAYPLMAAIILLCLELTLTDRVFRFKRRKE